MILPSYALCQTAALGLQSAAIHPAYRSDDLAHEWLLLDIDIAAILYPVDQAEVLPGLLGKTASSACKD